MIPRCNKVRDCVKHLYPSCPFPALSNSDRVYHISSAVLLLWRNSRPTASRVIDQPVLSPTNRSQRHTVLVGTRKQRNIEERGRGGQKLWQLCMVQYCDGRNPKIVPYKDYKFGTQQVGNRRTYNIECPHFKNF